MAHRVEVDEEGREDDEQREQHRTEAEVTVRLFEGEGVTPQREGVVFLQLHYFYASQSRFRFPKVKFYWLNFISKDYQITKRGSQRQRPFEVELRLGSFCGGPSVLNLVHFGGEDANVVAELCLFGGDPSVLLSAIDVFGGLHQHHAEADHCEPPNVFEEVEEVLRRFFYYYHLRTQSNNIVVKSI